MKKMILGIIIGVSFTALVGAGVENYIVKKQTAEVNSNMGFMVFTDCMPVMPYEKLGEIKVGTAFAMSDNYGKMRNALVKKARNKYPNADGILCYPESNGMTSVKADVIKFK